MISDEINDVFIDTIVIDDSVIKELKELAASSNTKKVPKVTPVPKDNESDIRSFSECASSYNDDNLYRLLIPMTHVKLDGDDVVIYHKKMSDALLGGNLSGDITIEHEIARIPKYEVIELLHKLEKRTKED